VCVCVCVCVCVWVCILCVHMCAVVWRSEVWGGVKCGVDYSVTIHICRMCERFLSVDEVTRDAILRNPSSLRLQLV